MTKAECELAAVALNAESQTATLSTDAGQPRGCYLYRISTFLPVKSLRFNSAGTETSLLTNAWAICRLGGEGPPACAQTAPQRAAAEESLQPPCLQPFVAAVEPHRFRQLDSTAVCLASRCIAHRFTDKRADKHRRHEPTHETR